MRALFLICLLALAGCSHTRNSSRYMPSDVARLEETVSILQDEIALLTRQISQRRDDPRRWKADPAAAARARDSYPHAQRVRDLQTMVEILERRKAALAAEYAAYPQGVIDTFGPP